MNINQLARKLEHQRRQLLIYEEQWGRTMGKKSLGWVMDNFEQQSYRDNVQIPWRIRDKSTDYKILQSARNKLKNSIKVQPLDKAFRLYSRVKYAGAHNDGFKGTVNVRAHQRRKRMEGSITGSDGRSFGFGENYSIKSRRVLKAKPVFNTTTVKAHSRNMNIPRRQFMPDAKRGSKTLVDELKKQTEKDILKILKTIK